MEAKIMYTKQEREYAAGIIRQIARNNQVSEAEVRLDLEETMNISRSHPDPTLRALWSTFQYAGAAPTVEEFILWAAEITWGRRDADPL